MMANSVSELDRDSIQSLILHGGENEYEPICYRRSD